eukprot:gene8418-11385_t
MSANDIVPLLNTILSRLAAIESKIGDGAITSGSSSTEIDSSTAISAKIRAFDEHVAEKLEPFFQAAQKLGGEAAKVGQVVKEGWAEMRSVLLIAEGCKEPPQASLPDILSGVYSKVKETSKLIGRNEWEMHAKTCSEGIQCLNWLAVKPAPCDFIENFVGGSDYWANNIRKQHKSTGPDHIAFCDTFKALLLGLVAFVKENHRTGVSWNAKGVDIKDYKAGATAAPTAAPAVTKQPAASTSAGGAEPPKGQLFAELSKEGAITSGLKKVTDDMKTYKAEYKATAPLPVTKAPVPKAAATGASVVKGPPKLEYQSGAAKWVVENQSEVSGVVAIEIKDKKETVYIYGCIGATIDIKNKCKSIVVDSCKKCNITFDSAMASFEVVNSQRMTVRVREIVPAVAIDKTDGIVVILSSTSLSTEIVASKSSEMNLSWPDETGELVEKPIPEQYVHRISNNTITVDVSDLYSH